MNDETKMITIRWKLSIGYSGADREGELEMEADASEEEVNEAIRDAAMQYVEYWRVHE